MSSYYIALALNEHPISHAILDFTKTDPNGAHWTPPASHHITLVHFGQNAKLSEDQKLKVHTVITKVVAHHSPIFFRIQNTADFGRGLGQNRFGKLMVESNGAIEALQTELTTKLFQSGFTAPDYKLSSLPPHITVVRQPGAFGKQSPFGVSEQSKIQSMATVLSNKKFDLPFQHVALMENDTVIALFNLTG